MTIENANDHPFKVAIVKDADLFANSHPFKVYIEGGGSGAEARVVDELPEEGESGYIYLVLKEQTEEGDIYDEYIWALQSDGETYGWEHLGATNEVTIVLYDSLGNNTDGAMTQKAVTDSLYADGASKTQIQLGNSVSSGANSSIAIGKDMIASGSRSIAIGERTDSAVTTASGASSVSIGVNTAGTGANGIAIGVRAKATGSGAVALGTYPEASGDYSFAMHYTAVASGDYSIAIGMQSQATKQDSIALGVNTKATGLQGIAVGRVSEATGDYSVSLGQRAKAQGDDSTALGADAIATADGSVALGAGSQTSVVGEVNIGSRRTLSGYNNSNYRLLTGLYDGQSAHDAATYGQVISYSAINGAGAPTTATEGKYVGQLYYDTTNEAMYFLKTIDTTTTPITYTWEALGGGSSVNVVQTVGTSTTDVMSQNATTSMVFADPSARNRIQIGQNAIAGVYGVAVGGWVSGQSTTAGGAMSVALGLGANVDGTAHGGISLGAYSHATRQGELNVGSSETTRGYNSSNYRLISGVYDGQSAHDAATKGQLDSIAIQNAGAPTTSTVGTVGQLLEDTTNGKLYICTDATNPYVWEEVGAGGGGGGFTTLTAADYDWNTSTQTTENPNAINLWTLPAGLYYVEPDVAMATKWDYGSTSNRPKWWLVTETITIPWLSQQVRTAISFGGGQPDLQTVYYELLHYSWHQEGQWDSNSRAEITTFNLKQVIDDTNAYARRIQSIEVPEQTAGEFGQYAYTDWNNGQTFYDNYSDYYVYKRAHDAGGGSTTYDWQKIVSVSTIEDTVPTTSTVGTIGEVHIDDTTKDAYMCVAVTPQGTDPETYTYTWKKITV